MKFKDFDKDMRIFETNNDHCVLPYMHMIARLDGRHFTKMTRDLANAFEAPFDTRFSDLMRGVVSHIMKNSGFRFVYGYTQSDEISLLFHSEDVTFNRKTRKLDSILASEAGAYFSLVFGKIATFDSRIVEIPVIHKVVDYFNWRQLDATRNALNAWCYWTLRKDGYSERKATSHMMGKTVSDKNELLFKYGINFNDIALWQKRGIGFAWEYYEKQGINGLTGEPVTASRKHLAMNTALTMGEEYKLYIENLIE